MVAYNIIKLTVQKIMTGDKRRCKLSRRRDLCYLQARLAQDCKKKYKIINVHCRLHPG